MNPFQAIMGRFAQNMNPMAPGGGMGGIGGLFGQVQQLASVFQNPQRLVNQFFPDAPSNVSGDPDQLISWLQQTGKVDPQMVQMARQMMGGR